MLCAHISTCVLETHYGIFYTSPTTGVGLVPEDGGEGEEGGGEGERESGSTL